MHRRFRHAVGDTTGPRLFIGIQPRTGVASVLADYRADVDDAAPLALSHELADQLTRNQRALHVDPHHPFKLADLEFQRTAGGQDPCDIDQRSNRAHMILDVLDHIAHGDA
ncbi:hypothetical protein D3C85_770140 [compost metagenome]